MVEQRRSKKESQGNDQGHHQAQEDDGEMRAADGAYGCGHSSRTIILFANFCDLFSHPRHPSPLCRRPLLTWLRFQPATRALRHSCATTYFLSSIRLASILSTIHACTLRSRCQDRKPNVRQRRTHKEGFFNLDIQHMACAPRNDTLLTR